MAPPNHPSPELPTDLMERMHRLAEADTATSRPWPGVAQALRRSRHRRLAGATSLLVASALVAGAALSGALDLSSIRSQSNSPASHHSAADLAGLRNAGFVGPAAGSLGHDRTWLKELRRRVKQLARQDRTAIGTADVQVLWTGDLAGGRYALVVYLGGPPPDGGPVAPYTEMLLAGPPGADADQLAGQQSSGQSLSTLADPRALFVLPEDPNARHPRLVLVAGPKLTGVKVATERHFSSEGKVSTVWRPLSKEGAVWVGQLTEAEAFMSDLSADDGHDPLGSGSNSIIQAATAIAPPGTNHDAVAAASDVEMQLGASIAEQPVLAISTRLTPTQVLAAVVLRSPDGPYLVSFGQIKTRSGSDRDEGSYSAGAIFPGGREPDALMAAAQITEPSSGVKRGYLVLAPVGATTVTIGDQSAPVHNRLAVLPRRDGGTVTVRARDGQGKVIASVRSKPAQ